jgi:cytochrome c-type biogenesis protein CcmH/NrfG
MGRWRRRSAILLIVGGAVAGVTVLLEHAVTPRTAGETISGTAVDGAGGGTSGPANHAGTGSQVGMASQGNPINSAGGPASPVPGASPSRKPPTRQQLMAVAEAEAVVQQNPRSVTAHLALASAYVAAGASQLAAVEWLAVTQLDPGNAEASTDLALLAFEVGRARQARTMVDRALATNPKYPEGLYVRGLIDLMGLRQPAAAVRDLNAYLAAAPYGSHRTDAVTLIALAQAQGHP